MKPEILKVLARYYGATNKLGSADLEKLLDESSRKYKISKYNDAWDFQNPVNVDADAYDELDDTYKVEGYDPRTFQGIKWSSYKIKDALDAYANDIIKKYGEDEYKALSNLANLDVYIPYDMLPDAYKESYNNSYSEGTWHNTPTGRVQFTSDDAAKYYEMRNKSDKNTFLGKIANAIRDRWQ